MKVYVYVFHIVTLSILLLHSKHHCIYLIINPTNTLTT